MSLFSNLAYSAVARWARRLWNWLGRAFESAKPTSSSTRRGAALGILLLFVAFMAINGWSAGTQFGRLADIAILAVLALLAALLLRLSISLLPWLHRHLLEFIGATGLAAAILLLLTGAGGLQAMAPWLLLALALAALAGGSLALLFTSSPSELSGSSRKRKVKRGFAFGWITASIAALGVLFWWASGSGTNEGTVPTGDLCQVPVKQLSLENPGLPGPYTVQTATYGSGNDLWREDFQNVTVQTDSVDGTVLTKGFEKRDGMNRILRPMRNKFWGFSMDELPLNGRVWYPESSGERFPLVLIVHGNHNMSDFSDPGYGYLGELLASRGIILVSIDENFLNGSAWGGVPKENDARGWILLEHLRQWRDWQEKASPANPLSQIADLDRVALIGHSRGGEAVGVAAMFNQIDRYPDDATFEFDYNFNLRGIVAIAPVDGQYRPAGRRTTFKDVSYLVLHGAHDADVSDLQGERLYNRLSYTEGSQHFKASLYNYRSNHGQFNTTWGAYDAGFPFSRYLNTASLLGGEAQRNISRVAISAFLETVFEREPSYRDFFREPRAGSNWLPEDLYVHRFEDGRFFPIADFDDDFDPTTATLEGGRIQGDHLAVWKEADIKLRDDAPRYSGGVVLGWRSDTATEAPTPSLEINWPPEAVPKAQTVVFSLAHMDQDPPDPDESEEDDSEDPSGTDSEDVATEDADTDDEDTSDDDTNDDDQLFREPLRIEVTLRYSDAGEDTFDLSQFRIVYPPLPIKIMKLKSFQTEIYGSTKATVLQLFEIPIDPERSLSGVRWTFDPNQEAVVALDRFGVMKAEDLTRSEEPQSDPEPQP